MLKPTVLSHLSIMDKSLSLYRKTFYLIIGATLLFVSLSNPFFKIPYDPWFHVLKIASLHDEGKSFIFWPEDLKNQRYYWHLIYAVIFKTIGINNIFLWAKVIHVFQFLLAFVTLFYFCMTVFKILFPDEDKTRLQYLTLVSVVFWFIGNGTFSVQYQQAWIMWYSVTYQGLTIPLFWYITALTLKIFYENDSQKNILFYAIQIILGSALTVKIHSMELLYYLIHLSLISILNYKKLLFAVKKYYFKLIIFSLALIGIIIFLIEDKISLISLIGDKDILNKIYEAGSLVTSYLNRFCSSFSEIAILSLSAAIIFIIYYIFHKKKYPHKIINFNVSLFLYLLLTAILFFLIPVNFILAGIAAYLTNAGVVYRFFFASPWFIFLPMITFLFLKQVNPKMKLNLLTGINVLLMIILIILSTTVFSGTLYHNVKSIIYSFDKVKVGIQYSADTIEKLREIILKNELACINNNKPNIYYIRSDLALIVRGVFRKYVYQLDTRSSETELSFYLRGFDKKYNLIDINLSDDFPKDKEIFRYFLLEKKKIYYSSLEALLLPKEKDNIKFSIIKILQTRDFILIRGFVNISEKLSSDFKLCMVLKSATNSYVFNTKYYGIRSDEFDGFLTRAVINTKVIPNGKYKVGIYIKNSNEFLKYTDKVVEIK